MGETTHHSREWLLRERVKLQGELDASRRASQDFASEIAALLARATAAEQRATRMEEAIAWFENNVRRHWSFDENQRHTHDWHAREDFIGKFHDLTRTALAETKA